MGAATAMAFTLEHPERVPALVQITPAYTGYARTGDVDGESWERARHRARRRRRRVRGGGPAAGNLPERWREVAREATRQRMERHDRPERCGAGPARVPQLDRLEGPRAALRARGARARRWARRTTPTALHPLGVAEEYARKAPELRAGGRGQGHSRRWPGRARACRTRSWTSSNAWVTRRERLRYRLIAAGGASSRGSEVPRWAPLEGEPRR